MGARLLALAGAPLVLGISVAVAQQMPSPQMRLAPAEIARLPSVAPGAGTSGLKAMRMAVLYGNPDAIGPYTIVLQVPPNTRIKAHTHRDDRTAVVVRGVWHFGYGSRASEAAFRALGPGSFYAEPAAVAHFARTGPEGATVYISGWGPTDTHYVE